MDKVRKELLAALNPKAKHGAWSEEVLQLIARDNARDDDFKLEEFLQTMAEKDQGKVWEGIASHIATMISTVTASDEHKENHEESDDEDEDSEEKDSWRAFRVLQAIVALAQTTLNVLKKATLPDGLLQVMIALHDVLFQLTGVDGEALQASITKVCEQWWKEERGGAEFLVAQTLPYLVARSLEEDAREVMVKRVYAMRGALLLLDYEEEATVQFRLLLLQCFLKPTYLRSPDGCRLLTYLFGLHPELIADIHDTVKAQLPHAKKKLVKAYGDVYFRAWKAATGPYLEAIEQNCIQDLMHVAVECPSPSLYANLRLFLQSFHSNKRLREVDAMLLRLYNPIIWRSLRVANPIVRAQSTGLLVDAFPLQNPDAGAVELADLLQKQLDILQTLLIDPDPHVRVAAIIGVCRILTVYWEAVPLGVIKAYVTRLVGSLAFDSSSPLVRLAVMEGLCELLEQPLAHPVLKTALPMTAPLLHDRNTRVRSAFVGLLQKVKGVRDIKFYQVVEVDQLLARFAEDANKSSALCARMTDLLCNSYFPQGTGVTGSKQVSRCLTFLSQSKPAALAFYSRLRDHASLSAVTRLAVMLLKCVFAGLQSSTPAAAEEIPAAEDEPAPAASKGRSKGGKKGSVAATSRRERKRIRGGAEISDEDAAALPALDNVSQNTLSGMLEIVAVLWASIAKDLKMEANRQTADLLRQTLAGQEWNILYERLGNASSLLRLAAISPEIFAAGLGAPMTEDLKHGEGPEADARAGPIAALLCAWGKTREVIDLIASGIEAVVGLSNTSSASAAADAGKRKRAVGTATLGQQLAGVGQLTSTRALAMLHHILGGESEAAISARSKVLAFELEEGRLREALEAVGQALNKRLAGTVKKLEKGEARQALISVVEISFRLELHLWGASKRQRGEERPPLSSEMQKALTWLEKTALPAALRLPAANGGAAAAAGSEGGAAAAGGGGLMSPLSPPLRRPRMGGAAADGGKGGKTKASSSEIHQEECAALAQEVVAAAMTVVSDWVAVGAAADLIGEKAETWAQCMLLPALTSSSFDSAKDNDEGEVRARHYAVLALLPQLCRLAYQLGLQESRGTAHLPAALLEVIIRSADYRPDEQASHRHQDSNVDGTKCLAGLLGLYGRLRESRPALEALVHRLTALCLQEMSEEEEVDGNGNNANGREVPPSALIKAMCGVMARSTPALNMVVTTTISELKEAAAGAASGNNNNDNQQANNNSDKNVEIKARLLATLFESAAEKAKTTLLSKVSRSIEQALEGMKLIDEQRKQQAIIAASSSNSNTCEGGSPAFLSTSTSETDGRVKAMGETLGYLHEKLRQMTVQQV